MDLGVVLDSDTMERLIRAFHVSTGLPIQVLDNEGKTVIGGDKTTCFCQLFQTYTDSHIVCSKIYKRASQDALRFGGAYIFNCIANLNNIVFPIVYDKIVLGSVVVGPFLLDGVDSWLLQDLALRYPLPVNKILLLYDEMHGLPVVEPSKATEVSELLGFLLGGFVVESQEQLRINREILKQQSALNLTVQEYKTQRLDLGMYPLAKEKILTSYFILGDQNKLEQILDEILAVIFHSQKNYLEDMKSRGGEICVILSRISMEMGGEKELVFNIVHTFSKRMVDIETLDVFVYELKQTIQLLNQTWDMGKHTRNESLRKAKKYILDHSEEEIKLENIAQHVGLHPSYLSTSFKKDFKISIREYISQVRIEKSKILLLNPEATILEIALTVGFETPSYFAKVFKVREKMTPQQYQKINQTSRIFTD